ncbi:hydroxymethylglutaryl-CoA reductase [Candidatus Gottesmanbacteria bacterium]|nr:hydroxymethylglutaryl-CoA reductase [Candidatus Gottesmanbacteria bacterium]
MNVRQYKTVKERREAVEKTLGISLSSIGTPYTSEEVASKRNCENMIGVTTVPIGVAGPLKIKDQRSKIKEYFVPLSTTEGALAASISRGCKAITESGGAIVGSHRIGATRGPVFRVKNLTESEHFYRYLKDHLSDFQKVASKTSHHIKLEKLLTRGVGKYRYVRFVFDTKDAMGMNMVTIATQALTEYIEKETRVVCLALAGNFDIDKKPAWLNFIENRGTKVWAEVTVSSSVLEGVLKTTAQKVYDVWLAKCMVGSAISGSMGFNAQYANVAAAIFLATGQDLGHVGEASMGITTCEIEKDQKSNIKDQKNGDGLYISVCLPDLMVGTVGGGTGLATQKEALSIMGLAGGSPAGEDGKNGVRLAEIIGGVVLAGEISLLASLSIGSLAGAHRSLARGEKI